MITVTVSSAIGQINIPTQLVANILSDVGIKTIEWLCNKPVNYSVDQAQRIVYFTPSADGEYVFTITVWNTNNERASAVGKVTVGAVVPPDPEPVPVPTGAFYDSNIQGKMQNGVPRFVTDREGNVNANGFGFTVNASGNGGIRCLGNGQFNIEPTSAGHRRMYIAACNYNGRLEGEFAFLTSDVRNYSIKTRSRHQFRDEVNKDAPDSKCQGGLGVHFSIEDQKVGFEYEIVHGTNGGKKEISLPKNLEVGRWYKWKYSYVGDTSLKVLVDLDYGDGQGFKRVMDHTASIPSVFAVKADFLEWSQFWLRLNDSGKIGQKNVRLFRL